MRENHQQDVEEFHANTGLSEELPRLGESWNRQIPRVYGLGGACVFLARAHD